MIFDWAREGAIGARLYGFNCPLHTGRGNRQDRHSLEFRHLPKSMIISRPGSRGMVRSVMIRSGDSERASSIPSTPSAAITTSNCSSPRIDAINSRASGVSSTTRIFFVIKNQSISPTSPFYTPLQWNLQESAGWWVTAD